MRKTLKIFGIIMGSIIALVVVIVLVFVIGSNMMGARYDVEDPVYSPDKVWKFTASFYSSNDSLLRRDTIFLTTYDERFLLAQNKVTWTLQRGNASTVETTGLVETGNKIWLHPPRFNDEYVQYTEYSAFPEIMQPTEIAQTWSSQLVLGSYETPETGESVRVNYKVEQIDTLTKEPLNRQITIQGEGNSGLGTYTNRMLFTDSVGFTKMTYTKANNERLVVELIERTKRN